MRGAPRNPKNTNMSPLASDNCTAPVETEILSLRAFASPCALDRLSHNEWVGRSGFVIGTMIRELGREGEGVGPPAGRQER